MILLGPTIENCGDLPSFIVLVNDCTCFHQASILGPSSVQAFLKDAVNTYPHSSHCDKSIKNASNAHLARFGCGIATLFEVHGKLLWVANT